MKLLALDCSTHVGWAFFDSFGAVPDFGTWHAPRTRNRDDYAFEWTAFEDWLAHRLDKLAPDVVGFEAPIIPRVRTFQKARAIRLSWGFAYAVETMCKRRRLRCIEANPSTVKAVFAGHGRAKKDRMVGAAIRRDWLVEDHNQADALGVALAAYEHIGLDL